MKNCKVALVIPCYMVKFNIQNVIKKIPRWVNKIICVDDCCPQNTGKFIKKNFKDKRIRVIFNKKNLGVGGATIAGFEELKKYNIDFVFKIDGDNQMDLSLLNFFLLPLVNNKADFVKGNRFTKISDYEPMPIVRTVGNIILSFLSRISSGYWNIFDCTNGYFCINQKLIKILPLNKISKGYFFENDLLNWLYIYRANILDIPIKSIYKGEISNLNLFKAITIFPILLLRNFVRRIYYEYFLRRFDFVFLSLIFGSLFMCLGIKLTLVSWSTIPGTDVTNAGTVGLVLFLLLTGTQFLLYFIKEDTKNFPNKNLYNFKK